MPEDAGLIVADAYGAESCARPRRAPSPPPPAAPCCCASPWPPRTGCTVWPIPAPTPNSSGQNPTLGARRGTSKQGGKQSLACASAGCRERAHAGRSNALSVLSKADTTLPRRDRLSPSHRRRLFAPLRSGKLMARRQPPHVERRPSCADCRLCLEAQAEPGFLWLLAEARGGVVANLAKRLFRSRPNGIDAGDLDFGDRIVKVAGAYLENLETVVEKRTSRLYRALWAWKLQDAYAGFGFILNVPTHSAPE